MTPGDFLFHVAYNQECLINNCRTPPHSNCAGSLVQLSFCTVLYCRCNIWRRSI